MRHLFTILLGAALLIPAGAVAGQNDPPIWESEAAVSLKHQASVEGSVIRLGDIFNNTGDMATRVIAYAPRPGGRSHFDAVWLAQVSRAYRLGWRPMSVAERIIVERTAQVVETGEIEQLVHDRLVELGANRDAQVKLANSSMRLFLAVDSDPLLSVRDMSYDQRSGRFSGYLSVTTNETTTPDLTRISGRTLHIIQLPVATKRIKRGEIITAADIDWIDVPSDRIQRNLIVEEADIIGLAAKRSLMAGRPFSSNDVRRPLMVAKGSLVTMRLTAGQLQLTAKGRAVEEGSKGDVIRIANTQSNTVVEGVVTGPGQVVIATSVDLAMK